MRAVIAFSFMVLTQMAIAETDRHSVFGVYRGQGVGNQSCTIAILEQRSNRLVAFLVDQNPHVFVSSETMIDQLNSGTTKLSLYSVERDFKDSVEISFDSKNKKIDVVTVTGNITAKCHKAFQIRRQD